MRTFGRRRNRSVSEVENRIRTALDGMRTLLRVDAFAIELVRFDPATRVAHLRVGGDCPDCDMTAATLAQGIEAHLRRAVPEVSSVAAEASGRE